MNELVKTLERKSQEYFLNFVYHHLITNCLDAFYYSKLSFNELKNIFKENINPEILILNDRHEYFYYIYNKIMNYSGLHFKLSYTIKQFANRNCPNFVKLYFSRVSETPSSIEVRHEITASK